MSQLSRSDNLWFVIHVIRLVLIISEIRYAFRLLGRSPGFTVLTLLMLAGGLSLSTFTFSFLYAAMIRPLPLSEGDRIVRLTRMEDGRRRPLDVVDVTKLRASMHAIRELGGYLQREVMLGRGGEGRVLTATIADPALFAVARTPAFLGRTLLPADAAAGAEPVVVLSYRTWEVTFGADRSVLDTLAAINGVSTRIVGVMPSGFGFPVTQDAWLPMPQAADDRPGQAFVSVFGRLATGATRDAAASEASAIVQRAIAARTSADQPSTRHAIAVESFPAAQIGEERTIVFITLNLLAALILLLSLVNVTTLLTARANERVRETAVRLALGASAARLAVQSMWESLILCIGGGIAGTAIAGWGLAAITRWTRMNMEGNLAFWWIWQMDGVTLLAAAAFVTIAMGVLGAVVSARAMQTNVRDVVQDGSARGGSRREGRLALTLIVTQVTTVTVLMFVAVLSAVIARRVLTLDPGYDPARLLQVSFSPPADRFRTEDARAAAFRLVQGQLSEHEAIDEALLRTTLAARGDSGRFALREHESVTALPRAHIVATMGGLSALGIELVQGRSLHASDDQRQPPVVAISRSLAERYWPSRSAIGDQVRLDGVGDSHTWRTIVGIVSDIPYGNPLSRERSAEAIYVPLLQAAVTDAQVIVRYRTSEIAGRQALNQVFATVDPLLMPGFVYRAADVIEKSGLVAMGLTKLFGACFAFALFLAIAGTYGLMSRSIALRTREVGVRRALGATDAMAMKMLLAQGARQLGIGAVAAAPLLALAGVAATQFLPLDGVLTATVAVIVSMAIVAVVLATTWLPTRKVLRVPLREALMID
jgi:predicted permease